MSTLDPVLFIAGASLVFYWLVFACYLWLVWPELVCEYHRNKLVKTKRARVEYPSIRLIVFDWVEDEEVEPTFILE